MRKYLTFHGVLLHNQPIRALLETGSMRFFEDDAAAVSDSVVDLPETEILRWLLGQPAARKLIYSQVQMDRTSTDYFSVAQPVVERLNAKPGDVDWLCVPSSHPHLSVAFECKRVKVRPDGPVVERVNKIEDLGRGVQQSKGLADMGFHRCYFMIIVQSDGRTRTDMSQIFRGAKDSTFKRIYEFPQRESLDDDVGVVFVEVVQPTGRAIGEMAYIGICVDRPSRPRDQSHALTARVRAYLRAQEGALP